MAFFVSPHGFGHAARACALINALAQRVPELVLVVYGQTPRHFFAESLSIPFEWVETPTDLGLVQKTPLEEDLAATIARLRLFLPFPKVLVDRLADDLTKRQIEILVADISPLGLAVARRAGIRSVLVENFTWDWIYRAYLDPELELFADLLTPIFATADLRLQTEPLCLDIAGARKVGPLARAPRQSPLELRRQLGLTAERRVLLLTLGGFEWPFRDLERHLERKDLPFWIVMGAAEQATRFPGGLLLPHRSPIYHPDLVTLADVVVAKLGYSTVAEAATLGRPLGFIRRPGFAESACLEAWVSTHLAHCEVEKAALEGNGFVELADQLLALEPRPPIKSGADAAATAVLELARR